MYSLRSSYCSFVYALIAVLLMQTSMFSIAGAKAMTPDQLLHHEKGLMVEPKAVTKHRPAISDLHLSTTEDCQHSESAHPHSAPDSDSHAPHAGQPSNQSCDNSCDCCNAHHSFTLALIDTGTIEQPTASLSPPATSGQPTSFITLLLRPPTA